MHTRKALVSYLLLIMPVVGCSSALRRGAVARFKAGGLLGKAAVKSVAFSADGRFVAALTGSPGTSQQGWFSLGGMFGDGETDSQRLYLWELPARRKRAVFRARKYVFSPKGELLAVMNHGIIEQIGRSEEIYELPKTDFVANFIGETNLIEGELSEIDGSGGILTSNGLSIHIMSKENLTKGQQAFVSIRPEKIEISEQLSGLENIFNGTVVETIYQGLMSVYTIMIEGRIKITVRVQNVDSTSRFSEGLNVQIGWNVEKGIVITEDHA